MRASLVVLAACSTASPPPPSQPGPAPITTAPDARLVHAGHAAMIRQLAFSEDGSAALSVDADGKLRLWPLAHGGEPVVIAAPEAVRVALGRDGDGFVIAVVDTVGILALVRTSGTGAVRGRTQLATEAAVTEVVATSTGVLAQRADGLLDIYTAIGTLVARLAPDLGERIRKVVARHGGALALIDSDASALHGRWIALDGHPRWGGATPSLAIDLGDAALGPDHRHIAASTPDDHGKHEVRITDLATGESLVLGGGGGRVLGFVEPDVVAVELETTIGFFDLAGQPAREHAEVAVPLVSSEVGDLLGGVELGRAGDHRVAGAYGVQLAVVEAGALAFLGYRMPTATRLSVTPVGLGLGLPRVMVAASLRTRRVFDHLPAPQWAAPARWIDIMPLDDDHALALAESSQRPRWIEVIDLATDHAIQRLTDEVDDDHLSYEPATHLVATVGALGIVRLARVDPRTARVEPAMAFPTCKHAEVALLDPALARGVVADVRCEDRLAEVRAEDLASGTVPRSTRRITDHLAIDRTGRIYGDSDPAIRAIDREFAASKSRATIRPSPDGTLVAGFTPTSLTLVAGGAVRWTIALTNLTDVQWAGDRLVVLAGGLATVALADGQLVDRQCGWQFGYWENPFDQDGHAVDELCDGL